MTLKDQMETSESCGVWWVRWVLSEFRRKIESEGIIADETFRLMHELGVKVKIATMIHTMCGWLFIMPNLECHIEIDV